VPLPTVEFAHPTLIPRPFHREGWVYEEKVDGWRMFAYKVARQDSTRTSSNPSTRKKLGELIALSRDRSG
jgi:hypothetical protein